MPVYEYRCEQCDSVFDKLIRNQAQADHISCPSCQSQKVTKLISQFAFSGGNQEGGSNASSSSCSSCSSTNCSTCK